jgi:hypothetical protein
MNIDSMDYLENHHMTTEELIHDLFKRIKKLERRIETLENNQISESDLECYAEGLGMLEEAGGDYYD